MRPIAPGLAPRASGWSCVVIALALASVEVSEGRAADKGATARQTLATRGLSLSGNFAVTRQELLLRKRLDALDALIKHATAAHQLAGAVLEKNELIRAQLRQAEAANPASAAGKSPSMTEAKGLPTRLQSQMPDVTGLGEQTPLQAALIDWSNARGALEVAVLEIARITDALDRDYQNLAADADVQQALADLANARLGPAKDYRRNPRLAIAKDLFTAAQPVYRESGRWRIAAVLNERTPATFSFAQQSGPTTVTATLAQLIELSPDAGAVVEKQRLADRDVAVRRATLPALRLGKFVFRDLPVLLLPPEAEDLGSQLASGTLAGCRARLDGERMLLELEPATSAVVRGSALIASGFSRDAIWRGPLR